MKINLKNKEGLTSGTVLVDPDDYKYLKNYSWHICDNGASGYVNELLVCMHRFILDAEEGKDIVTHINGNKVDNRKANLKFVTKQELCQNKTKTENTTSQYLNVSYNTRDKKYVCKFSTKDDFYYVGAFSTELEAAEMHDKYVLRHNITFKTLFFPEKKDNFLTQLAKEPKIQKREGYTGVTKKRDKWNIKVKQDGTLLDLGTYSDQKEAARIREIYIMDFCDAKFTLNFNWSEEELEFWKESLQDTIKTQKHFKY